MVDIHVVLPGYDRNIPGFVLQTAKMFAPKLGDFGIIVFTRGARNVPELTSTSINAAFCPVSGG